VIVRCSTVPALPVSSSFQMPIVPRSSMPTMSQLRRDVRDDDADAEPGSAARAARDAHADLVLAGDRHVGIDEHGAAHALELDLVALDGETRRRRCVLRRLLPAILRRGQRTDLAEQELRIARLGTQRVGGGQEDLVVLQQRTATAANE
jgi:hypothetical protein